MTEQEEERLYDLFISHSEADRAWVEGYLLDALTRAGVRYHSEAAFALGAPRLLEFERAVQQSQRTLLVLSPAYLAEGFTQFTDLLAQSYGLETATWPVIPLILHPVELPPRLAMLTRLDATDPHQWPAVIERLCAELQRPAPGPPPKPPCPYPGMVPFSADDARFFYGRDGEIRQMLQHLRHQRFLFVIGPSGCGKSSLIFAGLLPQLAHSSYFSKGFWLVRDMRPGAQPLQTLGEVIGGEPAQPARAVTDLLAAHPPAQHLLLVVDQFEELFTQAERAEQTRFIAALQDLRAVESCALLIAMRADFYPDLMNSDLWPLDPSQRLEIAPLRGEALRQAVQQPAEDVGVYLEAGLLERLLADAADEPGVLPLLQETMVLLWGEMQRRLLPLSAYEQLGGEGRSGLAVAIATKADATLAELAPAQQVIARRLFLRLVQFGEGRPDMRRQQPVAALRSADDDPDEFDRTLEHLARNRLLTLSGEEGGDGRRADISHEALIGDWPALQGWLAERREAEQTRRRLEAKAAEWVRLGRGSGGLLDEVELAEAERWLASPDAADLGYGETLPALVQASRTAIEKAEREQEAARQRELAQAHALAEEQERRAEAERQRAEEQSRAARRLLRLAAVLAVVFLLAVGAAVFAWFQQAESERLRFVSIGQALAAQAARQHEQGSHDELGALLARQAFLFHQRHQGEVLGQIDDGLRTILGAPYFSHILEAGDTSEAVAFSSDDRTLLASGNRDGSIVLWDLHQPGDAPIILDGHPAKVISLAFSLDGQKLASASDDGTVIIWDVSADSPVDQPFKLPGVSVAFSPVSPTLALGSDDGVIGLWDLRQLDTDSDPTILLRGHDRRVTSLAFSPDGRRLASASWDRQVLLWNLEQPDDAPLVLQGHRDQVRSVAFSPDGQTLASGGADGKVILWNVSEGGTLCHTLTGHEGTVTSVAFSPDGRTLASGGLDQTVWLWHLYESAGEECGLGIDSTVLQGHFARVTSVAFDQDGRLASGSGDETVRVWELIAAPTILFGHTGYVAEVAFRRDGQVLASGSADGTVRLWDLGQPGTSIILDNHKGPVTALAFSPDGRALVSGSREDEAIIRWDVEVLQEPNPTPIARAPGVETLAFSPDDQRLALGGRGGRIMLLDYAQRQRRYLEGHRETVFSVAFSPDRQMLASGSADETIILWDLRTGVSHTLPITHEKRVTSVAFSPVTRTLTLASGGFDGKVLLWDLDQPDADPIPLDHLSRVYSVAFSPDGQTLASASGDGTVWLWDLRQPEPLSIVLRGHEGQVFSIAFSPDGRMLASGGTDQTIRVWRIYDTATLADMVCENMWRNLTQDEWDRFVGSDVPYECTCPDLPSGEGTPPDACSAPP